MQDRRSGKRNYALPIATGENFEGKDIAPMEPDIPITKLPNY